ncbi:hypothetical protein [Mycoplasma feriruminatoris]|uniref:DUF4293 family protein n=1 Tax=Mycoplasma feriruminatoris TaxID=1179777 RepID=A0AAQ3HYN3_9MOLU|nr:hypothetical protein [Mycoplasma feriruminatoris]UKS54053.1 putative membrane protein [Mycoplasma feriruminatoris]WFQ90118.1 hypothetical protein MFERI11561_00368 [Mycoplasma feriruminatoris]WFQ90939.1 hypothetical protein MFERI13461_00372 [Mycoplasma feriruminatoris]WFQ91761.1 hypothetical protein MFERI14815_00373 [Mycoplasma feriruminatoris]WFQ92584.1 hypothetical protein MFERI14822_00372 [Mycoplasma feriruminatoris]
MKKYLFNLLTIIYMFMIVLIANESFGYGHNAQLHLLGKFNPAYGLAVSGVVLSSLLLVIPFLLTFVKKTRKVEKTLFITNFVIFVITIVLLFLASIFFMINNIGTIGSHIGIIVLYLTVIGVVLQNYSNIFKIKLTKNKNQTTEK